MAASTSFLLVLTGLGGPWQIAFNFSPLFTQATPELIARYPASGRYLIVARLNNHPCSPSTSLSFSLSFSFLLLLLLLLAVQLSDSRLELLRASPFLGHPSGGGRIHVHGGMNTSVRSKPMIMNAADRCVSLFGGTEGRKEGGREEVCLLGTALVEGRDISGGYLNSGRRCVHRCLRPGIPYRIGGI